MRIPVYPEGFYDYTAGVNIEDGLVNEWIQECIDYLEENTESSYMFTASGNTYVLVTRLRPSEGKYSIHVSKKHYDAIIDW